jgi:membrane associated rhomboid family serine protease
VTPWVGRLIVANVIVFVLQLSGVLSATQLAMWPPQLLVRPWTILTYMFAHADTTHIFFNMISLVFFGPRVESRLGAGRFVGLYFVAGLSAAVVSILFSPMSPIVGASGATFGVTLAFARFWPDAQILVWGILPMPVLAMVILTTVGSLVGGFGGGSGIAHFAHLGGYAGAWIYLMALGRWSGAAQFRRRAEARPGAAPSPAPAGFQRDSASLSRWSRIPRDQLHEVNRTEIERLLEKAHAKGVGSLTPTERETLDRFAPP